jgi:hypothetical protein
VELVNKISVSSSTITNFVLFSARDLHYNLIAKKSSTNANRFRQVASITSMH